MARATAACRPRRGNMNPMMLLATTDGRWSARVRSRRAPVSSSGFDISLIVEDEAAHHVAVKPVGDFLLRAGDRPRLQPAASMLVSRCASAWKQAPSATVAIRLPPEQSVRAATL